MLKVGITGGIGSGKSIISKVFETLGVPIFYADVAAKLVMHTDAALKKNVIDTFGKEAYSSSDGQLNRKYLAEIVFKDDVKLDLLNSMVHPAVFRAFDEWLLVQDPETPYILKEAALLFESLSYKQCHLSILVTSPTELRIQRVMQRDEVSEAQVLERMDKQLSDEAKAELADYIIVNDEKHLLIPQILTLHHKILAQSNQ